MRLFFIIYSILVIINFFATIKDFGFVANTPRQVYESNNLNMFGALCVWMIAFVLNPLYFIVVFIHWVFHVGRSDD